MRRRVKKILKRFIFGRQLDMKYSIGNIKHHNTIIDSLLPQLVEIGDNFVSAPGSRILTHDASLFFNYNVYKVGKVKIGNNVFLGAHAIVMPGVNISDNVIVGAGSVVTKDIESGVVVAGVPAKIICTVAEYYDKIKGLDNTFVAPDNFEKVRQGERLTHEDIYDFRTIVSNRLNVF